MSRSLERALSILNLFDGEKTAWGITEISQELDLPKSTVHGLVKALEANSYLELNEVSKYRLGIRAYQLGRAYSGNIKLNAAAEPIIRFLTQKHKQSIHLAIYAGRRAVFIMDSRAATGHTIFPRVGADIFAYCSGVGKVLLAWQSADYIENYLQTEKILPFTQNTITDPVQLKTELIEIRSQGFAVDRDEVLLGTSCIAAPILGFSGQIIAAISISGSTEEILAKSNFNRYCRDIVKAAADISELMGY